jgi:RTC4-like domain
MIQMKMFEDSQPGYYGPQGAELISQIVMEKFGEKIRKSDNLLPALKFCGGVTGYVSTVLVPEVGVRLIMEDLGIEREEAKGVMKESVEYGAVANAAVEISDDDDGSSDMGSDSD